MIKCNWCEEELVGYTITFDEVFVDTEVETIRQVVSLSCGCTSNLANVNIDIEDGFVEIEDLTTDSVMVEWVDPSIADGSEHS